MKTFNIKLGVYYNTVENQIVIVSKNYASIEPCEVEFWNGSLFGVPVFGPHIIYLGAL